MLVDETAESKLSVQLIQDSTLEPAQFFHARPIERLQPVHNSKITFKAIQLRTYSFESYLLRPGG